MITIDKRNFIKGKKITVSIRLPEELKETLEKCAKQYGRSFSSFIQDGLDQWAYAHLTARGK